MEHSHRRAVSCGVACSAAIRLLLQRVRVSRRRRPASALRLRTTHLNVMSSGTASHFSPLYFFLISAVQVSAKTGLNVAEAFMKVVAAAAASKKPEVEPLPTLTLKPSAIEKPAGCSC